MLVASVVSFLFIPKVSKNNVAPNTNAKNDLIGFFALVLAVVVGYQFTTRFATPVIDQLLAGLFPAAVVESGSARREPGLAAVASQLGLPSKVPPVPPGPVATDSHTGRLVRHSPSEHSHNSRSPRGRLPSPSSW